MRDACHSDACGHHAVVGCLRRPAGRGGAARPRGHQVVRRSHGARRRRPGAARRPGARPRRRERRRQVDVDEGARRCLLPGRGHDRGWRRTRPLRPPAPGPARRDLDGLPGVQPAAGALGRREHLPGSRTAPPGVGRHREDAARHPGAARGPRSHRHPSRAAGAHAVGRRAADRRDRQGDQLRCPRHPDGRADRRARRPRGRAALRHHPWSHPPRGRDPVRVPPAQGGLRPLRHHHRPQGRPAGRDRAVRGPRRLRAGPADGGPVDLVVLPRPGRGHRGGRAAARAARRRQRVRRRGRPDPARRRDRRRRRAPGLGAHRAAGGGLRRAAVHPRRDGRSPAPPAARARPARRCGPGSRW